MIGRTSTGHPAPILRAGPCPVDALFCALALSSNPCTVSNADGCLTVVVGGANRYFRIGLIAGILAIVADFLLELVLLRQLSVFNTGLGSLKIEEVSEGLFAEGQQ